MITITSKDYSFILIKDLNLAPNKIGIIDENTLILSELKSIESLYLTKKIHLSDIDLEKVRSKINGLDGNEGTSGDSPIQSISLNGNPLTPDNNKNVNINVSSVGGGGINVVDYYPEDNVIIEGPSVTTVNSNSKYQNQYLSVISPVSSETINEDLGCSINYAGVHLDFATGTSIKLDIKDAVTKDINGTSISNFGIFFLKDDKTILDFYNDSLTSTPVDEMCFIGVYKNEDETYSLESLWKHPLFGSDSDSATLSTSVVTLRKSTFIEYYLAISGLTLEELITNLGQEAIDVYSNVSVLCVCPDETNVNKALIFAPIEPSLTKTVFTLSSNLNNSQSENISTLDTNAKLLIAAGRYNYLLPSNISDGSYLNIKSDVILLNTPLKKDDYFLLYGNLTKGIRIPQTVANTVIKPTGTFRGYNIVQPNDAINGDWYLKDVWVQATTSYVQMIYVYVNGSGWKLSGYLPQDSNLSASLIYNSSSNRVKNSSGYNTAGYLGVTYNGNTPALGSSSEESLVYDTSYKSFRYFSAGQWWTIGTPLTNDSITNVLSDSVYSSGIPNGETIKNYINNKDLDWNKITNKPWIGNGDLLPMDLLLTKSYIYDSDTNSWVAREGANKPVTYINEPVSKNRLDPGVEINIPASFSFKGSLDILTKMTDGSSFYFKLGNTNSGGDPTYIEISCSHLDRSATYTITHKSVNTTIQSKTLTISQDMVLGIRIQYITNLVSNLVVYYTWGNTPKTQTIFSDVGYDIGGSEITFKGISGSSFLYKVIGRASIE